MTIQVRTGRTVHRFATDADADAARWAEAGSVPPKPEPVLPLLLLAILLALMFS